MPAYALSPTSDPLVAANLTAILLAARTNCVDRENREAD